MKCGGATVAFIASPEVVFDKHGSRRKRELQIETMTKRRFQFGGSQYTPGHFCCYTEVGGAAVHVSYILLLSFSVSRYLHHT